MANRRDFYFRQKVTEAELDVAFTELEAADRALMSDNGMIGVAAALVVAQQVSPNLTVQVSGPGVAYDQTGQRIAIPSTQSVNCALDEGGLSTAVVTPGNSRILSVFIEFDRALSDPRTDGNSATVYFVRTESFQFNVAKGAEAGSPTAPVLRSDQLLLADITLAYGATTIVTGNISTARRQWMFVTSDTPTNVGTVKAAIQILATEVAGAAEDGSDALQNITDHLANPTDAHDATAISYAGGTTWADSTTNPATTVEAQLDKIISDLRGTGGLNKLGALSGSGEILYSAVRAKTIVLSLSSMQRADDAEVTTLFVDTNSLVRWDTTATQEFIGIPLNAVLRTGQVITAVDVIFNAGASRATTGQRMLVRLQYVIQDFATAGNNPVTAVAVGSQTDSGTAGKQVRSITGLSHTVDLATRDYYLVVRAGVLTSFEIDELHGARIVLNDLGPRNF